MKAIQIKYLGPTGTKPSRWKIWSFKNKPLILSCSAAHITDKEEDQIKWCAVQYCVKNGWLYADISGIGTLPNGDYCVTLK